MNDEFRNSKGLDLGIAFKENLLQAIFDFVFNTIQVLMPVRDEIGLVTDFRIMLLSHDLKKFSEDPGFENKLYLEEFPEATGSGLFDKLVNIVEKKDILDEIFNHHESDSDQWFRFQSKKLGGGIILFREDITERVKAKERTDQQTLFSDQEGSIKPDMVQDVINRIPAIITIYSINENRIVYANESRLKEFHITTEQIYELDTDQYKDLVTHPEDLVAVEQFMRKRNSLPDGEILEIEQRLKMSKGDWQWYKTSSRVFARNPSGFATHIISFTVNINSRKQAEENIRRLSQLLVIKDRELETCNSELHLFSNITGQEYKETFRHLYTRLENTISRDAKHLSNAGKADLRRIQASFQKLKLLTEDILSYSTIHSNTAEIQVDLNHVIKTLENELQEEIAETGTTIQYNNLPNLVGQPVLIALLLRHLIANAIKFRSPDRKPSIFINYFHVDGVNLHSSDVMSNIKFTVVSVIDNGIGFDNRRAKDLFSLFFRLNDKGKYKGSGMGLPICKKIMDIHQGFITAVSRNFHGATFNCFFPSETIRDIS